MELTPEQDALVYSRVPRGALVTGFVAIFTWIDPDTAQPRWSYEWDDEVSSSSLIGLLELTKHEVIRADERMHKEGDC